MQASYNGQFYLTWQGRERTSEPEHVLGASVGKKFGQGEPLAGFLVL